MEITLEYLWNQKFKILQYILYNIFYIGEMTKRL